MRWFTWILSLMFLAPTVSHAAAWVKRTDAELGLGNEKLELWFRTANNHSTAVRLVNRLSGRTIPLGSDDFSIGIEGRQALRAADFVLNEAKDEAIPGGRRLTLRSSNASSGLQLAVVYELGDEAFFLRRRVELTPAAPLPLREFGAWMVGIEGNCSHQGFGDPVLLDDTFWGVEFPAGHNRYADRRVQLVHYPGRTIRERFAGKSLVLGVSEPGRAAKRFRQYVETFRVTPEKTALFVNYNTWWTLMPPTEKNSLELLALFKKKLYDPYGESIDTFTLDDGWDKKESLWSIREDRFPRGFAPLVQSLQAMNARQGIWLSPSSGYNHAPWLAKHGYQANSNPWGICQSDPRYRRDIIQRVTELARQYDVAFFKFDGFVAACDAPGHAHLPGPYAQEANTEAYIDLLTAVRRVRPDIYLDPTCGIWLSPWWLQYADSLWGDVSGDYPDIIVPAPIVRDSATTTRDAVFRQRCREHPGFPPAAIEHLGIIVISPEKWEDNAMIVAGRGCRLLTLYIDPQFFKNGDRDWAFLASLLKWVRHNAQTLQRTELILGDPIRREPYGYAHFRGSKGILALRNPFIEPRKVQVKLDESARCSDAASGGLQSDVPLAARIVYPRHEVLQPALRRGDPLELELQGYETVVVQLEPVSPKAPVLFGGRYDLVERKDDRITYAIYGRPGEKQALSLAGPAGARAALDGKPLELGKAAERLALPVEFPGREQPCEVKDAQFALAAGENASHIAAGCTVTIPPGTKAAMHVVYDPGAGANVPVECSAQINGRPAMVRAVRTPAQGDQAHGPHPWTWFELALPEGASTVSLKVTPSKPGPLATARTGWWLCAEHPLEKRTLTLEFGKPLGPAVVDPLPLPLAQDRRREILTLRPFGLLAAGPRWGKPGQTAVYLDEIPPDEVTQDWGTLQRNRSVWEKEMVIAGKKYARGLGVHATSRIAYDLAGEKFQTFRAMVGRDEHAMDGKVAFQVLVDGKKVFDSGPMTQATPAKAVEVSVQGARSLELLSLDGGDGISGDHADWAEARLVR